MLHERQRAKWMGPSAALLLGLACPAEANAIGFIGSTSEGSAAMVIQVDDPEGADSGSGDDDSGMDASSDVDTADSESPDSGGKTTSGDEGSDGETDAGADSGSDLNADSDPDLDRAADSDTIDTDPEADNPGSSPDSSVGYSGAVSGSGEVDESGSEIDTGTSASGASTSTTESRSPSTSSGQTSPDVSESSASAPQDVPDAMDTAVAGRASAEIREAPSASVLDMLDGGSELPMTAVRPARPCAAGDRDCVSPDRSLERAPSRLPDSKLETGATGVWPPPTAPTARPAAAPDERALGISLVDPLRARDGLLLQGIIINGSGRPQAVPPMQISLKNKAGETLQRWTMEPPVPQLLPGQHKAFKAVLQQLPRGASRADVAFLATSPQAE